MQKCTLFKSGRFPVSSSANIYSYKISLERWFLRGEHCFPFSTLTVLFSRCDSFPGNNSVPSTPGPCVDQKTNPSPSPCPPDSLQPECWLQSLLHRLSSGHELYEQHVYPQILCFYPVGGTSDLNGCSKRSPVDTIHCQVPDNKHLGQ